MSGSEAVVRYCLVGLGMPPDFSDGWTFASLPPGFPPFIFGAGD